MGYYTNYDLVVMDRDRQIEQDSEVLEELAETLNVIVGGGFVVEGGKQKAIVNADEMKWYEWEVDMLGLSHMYPALVFQLTGHGEESGDVWRAWFFDGECEFYKRIDEEEALRLPDDFEFTN